jgi:ribonuclease HI
MAVERGISKLHIFGDSKLVVNWINGQMWNLSLGLRDLIHEEELPRFDYFTCMHIFRELNATADVMSKQVMSAQVSLLEITETQNAVSDILPCTQLFV